HDDFRKILGTQTSAQSRLANVEQALFGGPAKPTDRMGFRIESAHQGKEALEMVEKSVTDGDPYVLVFMDVRMPPGWDGVETLEHIWKVAPDLQAVICTAYSDYSWDDMTRKFGRKDNLLILKKPFETVEVLQMANALVEKWMLGRKAKLRMEDLDRMVQRRTHELVTTNHKLHLSEERFSKAFQASPIPMVILRCEDHRFLDANQSFIELSGYPAENLFQTTDRDLQLLAKGLTLETAISYSPTERARNQTCVLRRSDDSIRQTLVSVEPMTLGETPCLLLIAEDITEQLKLEAQLRQSQKMEVVGRMSAGIAHEFNNLLTVIQGDVGLLKALKLDEAGKQNLLDQIMHASQRAANLTRQLLSFSRKQVLQPKPLNVSDVVHRMKKMLARLIGERHDIQMACATDLPPILADEGGLEQILINLVVNARDAMAKGGTIQISTSFATFTEATKNAPPNARAGKFVCMTVADNGCGMPPAVLGHLFEPFFTTKDVGKGSGLGLSTIHGIVKQHDGWIDVTSHVNQGSTFHVYLPIGNEPSPVHTPQKRDEPVALARGQGETILVVEDEPDVRELAIEALQQQGYCVVSAGDGPDAIQIWEKQGKKIDLLLTDMIMPSGMSGSELARTLQALNPKLKVIYTSGYTPEFSEKDSNLSREVNFLPKPYDLTLLLNAVRRCLDGGQLPRCEAHSA
ncbi:MAG TPA: response regulator, partial [Verrucomicrobiae bacterium]|nr:response regulator [Verrucomicrobiae bacterium]